MHIASGWLDLLAIDDHGRLGVYDLKRGTLVREAVSRIINDASDLDEMGILPRAIGWGGKAFGSTPDPWPGMQVACDLWKARDRGGGLLWSALCWRHAATWPQSIVVTSRLAVMAVSRLFSLSSGTRLPTPVVHLATSLGMGLSRPPNPETPSNKNPCLCQ